MSVSLQSRLVFGPRRHLEYEPAYYRRWRVCTSDRGPDENFLRYRAGILLTVVKAILDVLISAAGVLAACSALVIVALYVWRRLRTAHRSSALADSSARADNVICINR